MSKLVKVFLSSAFLLVLFTSQSFALGGYNSLDDPEKKLLNSIQEVLGFSDDKNHSVKYKIYNNIKFGFESNWNSYWLGPAHLGSSKLKKHDSSGQMELIINNKENGTLFDTFIYNEKTKQITIISRQVRYSSREEIVGAFENRKKDTKKYEIKHETDDYGMLQEKGYISYELFHISGSSIAGGLVYIGMTMIDAK